MKKCLALILALLMVVMTLSACGKEAGENSNIPANEDTAVGDVESKHEDLNTVSSLEELAETMNCALIHPQDVEVTDEVFGTLVDDPTIAEYSFKVNGNPCYLRFSKADEKVDISGFYYSDGSSLFIDLDQAEAEGLHEPSTQYVETDGCMAQRWFTADGQYCFIACTEDGWSWDSFNQVCGQFMKMEPRHWDSDVPFSNYAAIQGYYMDETHIAAVVLDGTNVDIYLYTQEEDHAVEWIAENAIFDGTKLTYEKELILTIVIDSETNTSVVSDSYEAGAGYVEITDGILTFNGTATENLHGLALESILLI